MECLHPITLNRGKDDERVVPCGKCVNCYANRRAEWIIRLRAELSNSDFGLFVTLTYSDENIHNCDYVNEETGEVFTKQTPDKRAIQLFLKRLRKVIGNEHLRYFIISEYGDHTHRLHYHGIFFFKGIKQDKNLYDKITNAWGLGFVKFGDANVASITYCTKYVLKVTDVPYGIHDNIMLCSRRPALGSVAITQQLDQDNYHTGNLVRISLHGVNSRLPRLFRDKLVKRYELEGIDAESYKQELRDITIKELYKDYKRYKADHPDARWIDFYLDRADNNELKAKQSLYRVKKQNLF